VGLTPMTVGVSGLNGKTVEVLGYLTISGNARDSYDWFIASSQKLTEISSNLVNKIKSNLADLDDIATMDGKSDGYVLTWDTTQNKWSSQATSAGGISGWQSFTAADDSIAGMTGTYAISGDGALSISVPGYLTISGNARDSYNWYSGSSQKLSDMSGNIVNKIKNNLADLDDVADMSGKVDNYVLTWDDTQNKWSSQASTAGGITGWKEFVSGTGIGGMTGTYSISGDAALQISVLGYQTISGNAYDGATFSANAKTLFPASSLVNKTYLDAVSSNASAGIGFSGASDIFDHELYITSSNIILNYPASALVNKTYLDAVSSNAAAGVGFSGASDIFDQTLYITSANALNIFADSSSVITKIDGKLDSMAGSGAFYPSALGSALMSFSSNAQALYQPSGTGGYWTQTGSDIYYDTGEVRVAHSAFDMGDYRFQVSGDSYFSGNVVFTGEFSGLRDPTWPSGVATKHYVDNINLPLSGLTDVSADFDTDTYHDSGLKWNKTTGKWEATQVAGGADAGLYYPSALGKSLMDFSSNTVLTKTGFASVSNGGTISHGLPGLPTYANVVPSGFSVNFGTTCKVDTTDITVYLTAAGSRNVFWTASI
jgi:hypothetical protein